MSERLYGENIDATLASRTPMRRAGELDENGRTHPVALLGSDDFHHRDRRYGRRWPKTAGQML